MDKLCVTAEVIQRDDRIVHVIFSGSGGIGSEGNDQGKLISEIIDSTIAAYRMDGMIADFSNFEYIFGDWIGGACISAYFALKEKNKRIAVLAAGETLRNLSSLWDYSRIAKIVPLFSNTEDALHFLKVPKK